MADTVRCHRCGASVAASESARREVVVSRTPVNFGSLKTYGRVDLCSACAARHDRGESENQNGLALLVGGCLALGTVIVVAVLLVALFWPR